MRNRFNGRHGLDAFNRAYIQLIKEQAEDTQPPVDDVTTAAPTEGEENLTTITFKTADPTIIDVFNSGFASATFNVNVKSEDGEGGEGGEDGEETKPVDIDGTLISNIEVIPPENEGGETCPECGNNPCTCDTTVTECGENCEEDEVTEEDDVEEEDEVTEEDEEE